MKKQFQSMWTLGTLAVLLTAGISLNAQSTAPTTSSDPAASSETQRTQPTDPTAQQPATTPQNQTSPTADQSGQQTPDSQAQPSQTPNQATPDSQTPAADASSATQSFSGTIMKAGDKYVLQDESGKTYDIDHQDQVKQYEGKKVRVHGTLDASGKMIHVQ